jgi:hypothetical protein
MEARRCTEPGKVYCSGIGMQWDWNAVGLECSGIGMQWDWNAVGLDFRPGEESNYGFKRICLLGDFKTKRYFVEEIIQ